MSDAAAVLFGENAEQNADVPAEEGKPVESAEQQAEKPAEKPEVDPLAVVPDTAEGYELPLPEGADGEFAKTAAEWFKEEGIPKGQAQKLAEKWNEYAAKYQQQQAEAEQAAAAQRAEQDKADQASLKKEWGDKYDANVELGRRAVRQFEVSADVLSAIEEKVGYAGLLKMFSKIGAGLGEDQAVGLSAKAASGGEKTPEQILYPSMN